MKNIIVSSLILFSVSSYADDGLENYPEYYWSTTISNRAGSFSSALAKEVYPSYYAEAAFIDEGKQPYDIKNINKVVNLDLVKMFVVDKFELSLKAGITSSYFSHNGSGNGYMNHTGFVGENVGFSVSYALSENYSIEMSDYYNRYRQSDNKNYELYNFPITSVPINIGVKIKF